ncbi:DUF3043 domain-containing protein [Nocardioides sp. DS6]|uniref:DUF3043 domain-containing protein n=1 Tax=Nocardioides eburneus TaxID=3231482 RepID=A0ABV3STX4_9ACTN
MFGRKSQSTPVAETQVAAKPSGKGRPTPTRKEAEAARKARLKTPRTRKEQAAAARLARAESSQKMREAMKTGDDRYLPARDRGPVKRFVRDYVDSRFTIAEVVLPVLIVAMIFGYVGSTRLAVIGELVVLLMIVLVVINLVVLLVGMRRQIRARFSEKDVRGTTYYAVMRAMQVRFLRMPKPQVKIGTELPKTYR